MSWPFERFRRPSIKNSIITAERMFDRWKIVVGDYNQTSEGLNAIWSDALGRVQTKAGARVEHILILGLGAGGMLKDTYQRFPNCHITAVEYDKEMIALTKQLALYAPFPAPEIVEGDAGDVVRHLPRQYDLIAVDLFYGGIPSPLLHDETFIQSLKSKMTPSAHVVVNVAEKKEYLERFSTLFANSDIWKYKENWLGMFQNSV